MVDLHKLEQRWLRYKIKYYLPHFAVTISIIVITSTLIIYDKNFSKEIRKKETKKKQIEKKVALQTSIPIKKRIKKRIKKKTPSKKPMRSIAINKKAVVHSLCTVWLLQYSVLSHVCVLYGCNNTVFCPIFVLCMTYMTVTIQWSVPCLCFVWLTLSQQCSVLSHACVLSD